MTSTPITDIVRTGATGPVQWLSPERGNAYLADPFPWPGPTGCCARRCPSPAATDVSSRLRRTGRARGASPPWCSTMGRIIRIRARSRTARTHISCRRQPTGEPRRSTGSCPTRIQSHSVRSRPGGALADPTLFRHGGRYWIACTDLDIGTHDNLCLLHAGEPIGPWQPHRCTPVKIDVCGARPAGPVFMLGTEWFRPGQDCALHLRRGSGDPPRRRAFTRALPGDCGREAPPGPGWALPARAPHARGRPGAGLAGRQAISCSTSPGCTKRSGARQGVSWIVSGAPGNEHARAPQAGTTPTGHGERSWRTVHDSLR